MKEKINKNALEFFREEISTIDNQIIELLIRRFDYSCVVGKFKNENKIPIENIQVKDSITLKYSDALGDIGKEIYNLIHHYSVLIQKDESEYLQVRRSNKSK
jgi:chorismate mutase